MSFLEFGGRVRTQPNSTCNPHEGSAYWFKLGGRGHRLFFRPVVEFGRPRSAAWCLLGRRRCGPRRSGAGSPRARLRHHAPFRPPPGRQRRADQFHHCLADQARFPGAGDPTDRCHRTECGLARGRRGRASEIPSIPKALAWVATLQLLAQLPAPPPWLSR